MKKTKPTIDVSRRNAIKYGGGFLGTGIAATMLGSHLAKPKPVVAKNSLIAQNKEITPEQALQKLVEGNKRFVAQTRQSPNQNIERLVEVSESQAPFASILGCADSRVPAEIIFDQGLGDLFVCRIAGNIAIAEQIGSLEFSALILGSKLFMVLGHSRCGAVKATIEGGRFPGQIGTLIDDLQIGVERSQKESGSNKLEAAIKANVIHQVELLNQSSLLGDLVDKNQLKIVGAYYDLETGSVTVLT